MIIELKVLFILVCLNKYNELNLSNGLNECYPMCEIKTNQLISFNLVLLLK